MAIQLNSDSYDEETLHKLHACQTEILKDLIEGTEKHGINVFLLYGSLIGAVRHHGPIPWDDDLDVGMTRSDYNKFLKIMEPEFGEKYELLTTETDPGYACSVIKLQRKGTTFLSRDHVDFNCHVGIFVDIFVYDHVADGTVARLVQFLSAMVCRRLLFLSGTPRPIIPLSGWKKKAAQAICYGLHYGLKAFKIDSVKLFRQLMKISQKFNGQKSRCMATFEGLYPWRNYVSYTEMYPLTTVEYDGLKVKAFRRYDRYMTRQFGDYMQLPPEEKRENHRPLKIDFGPWNDTEA